MYSRKFDEWLYNWMNEEILRLHNQLHLKTKLASEAYFYFCREWIKSVSLHTMYVDWMNYKRYLC